MQQHPEVTTKITITCVVLYNFMRKLLGAVDQSNLEADSTEPDEQLVAGKVGEERKLAKEQ